MVPLVALNGLVHLRLLTNRSVTWRWMLLLSAMDIALATSSISLGRGFDGFVFAAYYFDQVVEYALLLSHATTVARVGFFLEQHRDPLMVDEAHLARLRHHRPRQPHHLDRARGDGRLVPEWNLVVPTDVMERSWAEIA